MQAAALAAASRWRRCRRPSSIALAGAMFALRTVGVAARRRGRRARRRAPPRAALDRERRRRAWADLRAPLAACATPSPPRVGDAGAAPTRRARGRRHRARSTRPSPRSAAIAATRRATPQPLAGRAPAAPAADDAVWVPQVDADMIEPFLEEAAERIEALSQKLLRLESAPGDVELVRDDLPRSAHLKGSSAFVGLRRMNRLAHAAEDLVGQLRDGTRARRSRA